MTEKPKRIQLKRTKGWKMPPNTVKVDRSTKWGNPFVVGWNGDLDTCITMYRDFIKKTTVPGLFNLSELRGKNLGCWCKIGEQCHADVLLELAND